MSRLGSHVDPLLAVFAPLWWVWPQPELLLTVQAVAVALGALPVHWLAEKHLHSQTAALGLALAYLLYPPIEWATLSEFHPVTLSCPLLLFAIWFLDEERLVPFAVFAVLAALGKEEIGLVVAGIGIWYALAHRRFAAGAAIAVAGVAATVVAVDVIVPHFHDGRRHRFSGATGRSVARPAGSSRTSSPTPASSSEPPSTSAASATWPHSCCRSRPCRLPPPSRWSSPHPRSR